MHFHILTLFPDFFTSPLNESIIKKAQEKKTISIQTSNIRDFSTHPNGNIDDVPYGGGGGMLIQAQPVYDAIQFAKEKYPESEVIYFSPLGAEFTQSTAENFALNGKPKILLCGHYEGIDERVLSQEVDHYLSIGSAIVTGGEIPALFFIDATARLIPEVIGNSDSHKNETFSEKFFGKGEYPQFTRPQVWNDLRVPEVLTSGDAKKIEDWKFANLRNIDSQEEKILHLRREKFSSDKPWKVSRKFSAKPRVECLLRIPQKDDITAWYEWFNDDEVTKYLRNGHYSWEEEQDYYNFQHYNLHLLVLAVLEKKTKRLLGNISLEILPEKPFVGVFGIVLGERDTWNKGYATALTLEILSIAEHDLGLKKVTLDVFTQNLAAQKVYEKCGFEKIGVSKKYYEKHGEYIDVILYEKIF